MTLGPTGKCANAIIGEIQDYLSALGYVKIAKGVSARALGDIVHAYEIQRIGQTECIQLRYGVNVYNTICQHLHDYLDPGSLKFKLPAIGRDSARVVDSIKEHIKRAEKELGKFQDAKSLLGDNVEFLADYRVGYLKKAITGEQDRGKIKENRLYWSGLMPKGKSKFGKRAASIHD